MTKLSVDEYSSIIDNLTDRYCSCCSRDEDCKIVNCILVKIKRLLNEHLNDEDIDYINSIY